MFLGCGGKRKENLTDNLLLKAKTLMILKSDERTTGRTLEVESPVLRLNKLTYNNNNNGIFQQNMVRNIYN